MQYGMVVDLRGCIGCHACSMACKMANNLPVDVWYNDVKTEGGNSRDTPSGEYPNNAMSFFPVSCQHCAEPACAAVCPTGATWKDEETGIVHQDLDVCIGCQSCVKACPYEGVRTFVEEPKFAMDATFGVETAPVHVANVVEKCNFCAPIVEAGGVPACMEFCIGRARFWGDLDDPESDVSKMIAEREYVQLNPEAGTEPNAYYLL